MMQQHVAFAAHQYRAIRDRLQADDPDLDEQTLADTVEGITDLHELISAIIRSALQDEALALGLRDHVVTMQGRLERLQERAAKRRQIARDAMVDTEIRKITAPDFTISVRPGTPALEVLDESAIPGAFYEFREPVLNRRAVLAELKLGGQVPGVQISSPEPVLSVRTK